MMLMSASSNHYRNHRNENTEKNKKENGKRVVVILNNIVSLCSCWVVTRVVALQQKEIFSSPKTGRCCRVACDTNHHSHRE